LLRPARNDLLQTDRGRRVRDSTGLITEYGLTAKTVIGALEDADDYKAFEAANAADSLSCRYHRELHRCGDDPPPFSSISFERMGIRLKWVRPAKTSSQLRRPGRSDELATLFAGLSRLSASKCSTL
jgi:hypothetical protein